jgi:uncharacterized protein
MRRRLAPRSKTSTSPYRPKRRTRATVARERGLAPLADRVWRQEPSKLTREALAAPFVDAAKDVPDAEAALAGARDICSERVAEDAALRGFGRGLASSQGELCSRAAPARKGERPKFEADYDHREPVTKAPSHRALAIPRAEAEEVLRIAIAFPDEAIVAGLTARVVRRRDTPLAGDLAAAVEDGWKRLMGPSIESERRRMGLSVKALTEGSAKGAAAAPPKPQERAAPQPARANAPSPPFNRPFAKLKK